MQVIETIQYFGTIGGKSVELIPFEQAALLLGVKRRTLHKLVSDGIAPKVVKEDEGWSSFFIMSEFQLFKATRKQRGKNAVQNKG